MKNIAPTLVTSCTALPPEGAADPRGGPSARRRQFLSLAGAGLLAGCGFHLRQAPDFAFDSLVMNAANTSPLAAELRRQLAANGKVQVLTMAGAAALATAPGTVAVPASAASAASTAASAATVASAAAAARTAANRVIFDLLQELQEKIVVGLNATGQVREFQLRTRVHFRLRTAAGKELIPDTELVQQRDISFNEGAVLAKESEQALLYRDMQGDLVQQIMRRLAAVKTL